jgi:hypothetical protein
VQGRTVEQYVRHAEELAPLVCQELDRYHFTAGALDNIDVFGEADAEATRLWAERAVSQYRIGIGSLCGRNRPLEIADLVRIVAAVADVLPGPFHLWGVKLTSLRALTRAGAVADCELRHCGLQWCVRSRPRAPAPGVPCAGTYAEAARPNRRAAALFPKSGFGPRSTQPVVTAV